MFSSARCNSAGTSGRWRKACSFEPGSRTSVRANAARALRQATMASHARQQGIAADHFAPRSARPSTWRSCCAAGRAWSRRAGQLPVHMPHCMQASTRRPSGEFEEVLQSPVLRAPARPHPVSKWTPPTHRTIGSPSPGPPAASGGRRPRSIVCESRSSSAAGRLAARSPPRSVQGLVENQELLAKVLRIRARRRFPPCRPDPAGPPARLH